MDTLRWQNGQLVLLDQTKLPLEESYITCTKWQDVYDAISLKTCVENRLTQGGPGRKAMEAAIAINRQDLAADWKDSLRSGVRQ